MSSNSSSEYFFWRTLSPRLPSGLLCLALALVGAGAAAQDAADLDVFEDYVDAEIGTLDPAMGNDTYAHRAISQVYETLFDYHYLKRPYTLQPCLAAAMPETSEDGKTFTIKITPGIRYQDDPCFPDGKGREMVADDFAYAWKRLADTEVKSPGWWIFDEKIVGLNAYHEQTADKAFRKKWMDQTGREDGLYRAEVSGIRTPDKYTIVVELTKPSPQFLYFLAMPYTSPMPWEAIVHYKKEIASHPVGTGAYTVVEYDGNSKVVFVASKSYRGSTYPSDGGPGDETAGRLADAGKKLPMIPRVELNVVVEALPRWLEFTSGKLDRFAPSPDVFDKIVGPGRDGLTGDYMALGMRLDIYPDLDITYTAFNMEDPIVGQNVYLRRAMSLAMDSEEQIRVLRNGRGIPAHGPIPPDIFGFNPEGSSPYRIPGDMQGALEKAQKLMERAGYPGGEGLPPLRYDSTSGAVAREFDEQFKNCMERIGVKIDIHPHSWPEFDEILRGKRGQVWGVAWLADYPDPENFLQLLYGANAAPGPNASNFKNPRYDELYAQMVQLANGPERQAVIDEMVSIVQKDCPWIFGVHRKVFVITQGWFRNYKYASIGGGYYRYYDVDVERKRELTQRFKR